MQNPIPELDLQITDIPGSDGTNLVYIRINSVDQFAINTVFITRKLRLIDTREGKPVEGSKVIKIPKAYKMDPEKSKGWQSFGNAVQEIPDSESITVDVHIDGTEVGDGGVKPIKRGKPSKVPLGELPEFLGPLGDKDAS